MSLILAATTQSLTFLPLALGICISYNLLRATDMTLDGSFVMGAGIFAHLIVLGFPAPIAAIIGLFGGTLAGIMVSLIQRGGRIDPLLAGVLATFILASMTLIIMGRPNINLLTEHTLVSSAFEKSTLHGWLLVAIYCFSICAITCLLISTRFGLLLRALGDNPRLLKQLKKPVEYYRLAGFALTNTLAASAGILTAQTVGYADTGMGIGMTLTGIGAIILGQHFLSVFIKSSPIRIVGEFAACLIGVLFYFLAINTLLRLDVDPIYLKLILGLVLILFLRNAVNAKKTGEA